MKNKLLQYNKLTNKEFNQFFSLIVNNAKAADPAQNNLQDDITKLEAVASRLLNVLNKEQASMLTKKIEEADFQRDEAVGGFMSWCRSYLKFIDPTKKNSAEILDNYFNSLGKGITTMNYQAETAILKKLVTDCKTNATYITALNTLGPDSTVWLDTIETENTKFEVIYSDRSTELGYTDTTETFISIRPEAIALIEDYYDTLQSYSKTNIKYNKDNTVIHNAIIQMDSFITQYKQLILQTQSKKVTAKTVEN